MGAHHDFIIVIFLLLRLIYIFTYLLISFLLITVCGLWQFCGITKYSREKLYLYYIWNNLQTTW